MNLPLYSYESEGYHFGISTNSTFKLFLGIDKFLTFKTLFRQGKCYKLSLYNQRVVDTVQKSGNVSYNWMLIPGIYEEGQRNRRTQRVR